MHLSVGDQVSFDIKLSLKEMPFVDNRILNFVKRNFPATIERIDGCHIRLIGKNGHHFSTIASEYLVIIYIQEKLE